MNKLNYWNQTWSLDEAQCPCDLHLVEYLEEKAVKGKSVFHFGTGNHHIVGLRLAENGSNNAVLGITASPQEYDDYVELVIRNPRLGHTYKAYFGDIYQLDARLLPELDYAAYEIDGRAEHAEPKTSLSTTRVSQRPTLRSRWSCWRRSSGCASPSS